MIAMAVGLVLIKIIWNVSSGYSLIQEINLITIVIAWSIYDSVRGSRFEHLAIFVWAFVSIELVRVYDKNIEDIYFLVCLGIFAIFTTILAFKWKKEMRNIENTAYDAI